tara:strand:+ start:721 stop:1119 length:399 start_codon:yes stop_codon:yes gene_type:complete
MKESFPDVSQFADAGMRGSCRVFRLTAAFRYFSMIGTVIIPKGFCTDGASVPRIFWNIFSPFGEYFSAALIHDFLYSKDSDNLFYVSERKEADGIFLQAMKDIGVGWLTRRTIYRAVRLGGWMSYKKKFSQD